MLTAQISLTLSCHPSLSSITSDWSSRLHPVSDVSLCWSANTGVSMCWSPLENVTYEFVLTFPAAPFMPCSSYLDGLWGWWHTTAILWVFSFKICSKQHVAFVSSSCLVFSLCFVHVVVPYSYSLEEVPFYFIR